jgi:ABC-type branched-subunit amino acid transport system substrate-binding protein
MRSRAPIRRVMAAAAVVAIVASACTTSGSPATAPATQAPATQAPATQAPATQAPASADAPSASAAAVTCTPDKTGPIKMTHLNYYTGAFADVGPWFKGITDFPIGIINQDPPLGRTIEVLDADIGTLGEAAVSKKAIESDKVEILLNVAHNYPSYRDWMLAQQAANDSPPMPSVHGGAITRDWGGTPQEPLMRGAPQDSSQASAAALYASQDLGAKTVVVVATEVEGSQLQKPAAVNAAKKLGMQVLDTIDIASTQPSYRDVINKVKKLNPDAVLIFSQAQDGGTFVKQAAEAGASWNIIGTTEWMGEAFPKSATMAAIGQHKAILIAGFSNMPGAGYDFYKAAYDKFAPTVDALKNIVATNSYNMQYYDLLNITALAVEKACSTKSTKWLPAMRDVAMAPGTKCYSYAECVKLVRAGTDIDYSGASGEMDYNATGVVAGYIGISRWTSLTNLELVKAMDGPAVVELDSVNK